MSAGQYDYLLPYCNSDRQRGLVAHLNTGAGASSCELYKSASDAREVVRMLKRRAAAAGISPEHDMVRAAPEGFVVKGTSTLYNADGQVTQQWVKTAIDWQAQAEIMRESLIAALAEYKGASNAYRAPKTTAQDLLTLYPFGDPHIGMYAWAKETGADFDCDIAERSMFGAVDRLCDAAPASDTGIVLSVGDTFHADTSDNKSLNSGHSFDVDSRWSRVLQIGVSTMIRCIDRALQKHKRVVFRAMPGNHDKHTSMMLNICLKMFYSNNKRVFVDDSPAYYWYYRFGKVLLGSTHGDQCKPEALPAIMADEMAQDWGETEYRYWLTGHIHTHNVREFRGCTWESFRTLAGRDAWHAAKGYKAGRDMYAITYSAECGEEVRHRIDIKKLKLA